MPMLNPPHPGEFVGKPGLYSMFSCGSFENKSALE
jgi:hypothetical protein